MIHMLLLTAIAVLISVFVLLGVAMVYFAYKLITWRD